MKSQKFAKLIVISLTLFGYYIRLSDSCSCDIFSGMQCSGCTENGRSCIDNTFCDDNAESFTLDSSSNLVLRKTSSTEHVDYVYAYSNCVRFSSFYGEITDSSYYNYIAQLIISKVESQAGYVVRYITGSVKTIYVKLSIDGSGKYLITQSMVLPLGQSTFANPTSSTIQASRTGMKIQWTVNQIIVNIEVGYYDNVFFDSFLCLGALDLTPPPSFFLTTGSGSPISSTTLISTTTPSSTPTSSPATTSATLTTTTGTTDCIVSCAEPQIEEICSMTYIKNGIEITEHFDCYELQKTNKNQVEVLQLAIEQKKTEQLAEIKLQTQQELKKLQEKYSVTDKVGSSVTYVAFITVAVFVVFVTFGDVVRLAKFILNTKSLKQGKLSPQVDANSKQKAKFDEKEMKILKEKCKDFDARVYELMRNLKKMESAKNC